MTTRSWPGSDFSRPPEARLPAGILERNHLARLPLTSRTFPASTLDKISYLRQYKRKDTLGVERNSFVVQRDKIRTNKISINFVLFYTVPRSMISSFSRKDNHFFIWNFIWLFFWNVSTAWWTLRYSVGRGRDRCKIGKRERHREKMGGSEGGWKRAEAQVGEVETMKWDNTDAAGRGSHHRMLMRGWRLLGRKIQSMQWRTVARETVWL